MPTLLAITPYPNLSADTRYRVSQFIPALNKAGWKVTVRPFMSERLFQIYNRPGMIIEKTLSTLRSLSSRMFDLAAGDYDAILLHKEAFPFGPPILEKVLKNKVSLLIYDMDDAFWAHPHQFKQIGSRFRDPERIAKMIGLSTHILAGNEFLADYAKKYNSSVTVFPTVLDTERYIPREEIDDEIATIGWVGRWSSEAYLANLFPVFQQLTLKYPNIEFKFIGATPDAFPSSFPVKAVPWRLESEIEDIASLDIGIMPLPDDEYSRGKCGFKLLQYMALGIPAVASPVGVNSQIIHDGINGFLAINDREWVGKLSQLIEDKSKRFEVGMKGRQTVEEKYSLSMAAPILLNILDSVSGRKK